MVEDFKNIAETIAAVVGITGTLWGSLYWLNERNKKLKSLYDIIWKNSSSLKQNKVLRNIFLRRPFKEYYYYRSEDDKLSRYLNEKKSVLVIGPRLAGKTRAVYQALTSLNKPYDILIPKCVDIESFFVPMHLTFWNPKLIIIFDLHRFVEIKNFEHLLRHSMEKDITIAATCGSGIEYTKLKNTLSDKGLNLEFETIELGKISINDAQTIADNIGKELKKVKFDGTVGSIFMDLSEMENRFKECNDKEKKILWAIKSLHICGIYEERNKFSLKWIKIIAKKDNLEGGDFEWHEWLEGLKNKGFIIELKGDVLAEKAYIEHIVKPKLGKSNLAIFEEMISILREQKEPDILSRLGTRAFERGSIDLEYSFDWDKIGIANYINDNWRFTEFLKQNFETDWAKIAAIEKNNDNKTIKVYTKDNSLSLKLNDEKTKATKATLIINDGRKNEFFVRTNKELKIFDFEKTKYIKIAIIAYDEALKAYEEAIEVTTTNRFPIQMQYARTQDNLGIAFSTLAEVEDETENRKKANIAYEKALNCYRRIHESNPKEVDEGLADVLVNAANNCGSAHAFKKMKSYLEELRNLYTTYQNKEMKQKLCVGLHNSLKHYKSVNKQTASLEQLKELHKNKCKEYKLKYLPQRVRNIVEETTNTDDKLLAICKLLNISLPHYDWVGFYLVDKSKKRELVLGPFVGEPTEHVRIPFGKGVCGKAAELKATYILYDVSEDKDYLACSLKVKSEIVVPIFKNEIYLFSWNKIPENDNENEKLKEFLKQSFGKDWVKSANIVKTKDGRAINISSEKNSISLELNDKKTILAIDGIGYLIVRTENGKLNVYDGEVIGELDIDSFNHATFTEEDKKFLEDICKTVSTIL